MNLIYELFVHIVLLAMETVLSMQCLVLLYSKSIMLISTLDILAEKRHLYKGDFTPIKIKGCMKQHLFVLSRIQQKLCVVNTFAIAQIVLI